MKNDFSTSWSELAMLTRVVENRYMRLSHSRDTAHLRHLV